ncbi:hypothetical protein HMI56_005329, partial [Coelomomyces lativittatus]
MNACLTRTHSQSKPVVHGKQVEYEKNHEGAKYYLDPLISTELSFEEGLHQWNLFRKQQASKFVPYLGVQKPSNEAVK